MLDRQKIEAILTHRFPGATLAQVAAATNAIMGLDDETPATSAKEPAMTMTLTPFKTSVGRALGLLLAVSGVFLYGCNSSVEPKPAVQQAAPPAPAVPPAVSINAVMVGLVDNAGHVLWDVEQSGGAPKNDADWRKIEYHAIQLAAAGPLIALGGTGQADPGWAQSPDWKKYSQELTNAGLVALNAARSKNVENLVKANGQLVDVCEACHKEFKPDLPTEGLVHKHQ